MITLALIGLGQWGKNYLDTIKSIPGCQLKYVCAKSSETLESLPDSYIKVNNYQDLLKFTDIDGVIIATPGETHFQIAAEFLKSGQNILIEKPVTIDLQQALELEKISQLKRPVVLVGHIYLYNPAIKKVKQLVKEVGSMQYLTFEGLKSPIRSDMSSLWEWGPHGISLCLEILQQKPIGVSAWAISKLRPETKLYDLFIMRLDFPNNLAVFIKGGWLAPIKKRELVIVGSEKTIVFDDLADKKITLFENTVSESSTSRISYPAYSEEASLQQEVLEFIDCIKNGKKPLSDLNQAIEVSKIIHLAEQSILQEGKRITI